MNELEPDAETAQWLWFGAALLAMTIIALVVSLPTIGHLRARSGCERISGPFEREW
jgi:hypothetical protein